MRWIPVISMVLPFAALPLAGCGVDPAPADLDGDAKWFWVNYEAASDADIGDAVNKLHPQLGNDGWTDPRGEGLTALAKGDLAVVGLQDTNDPSTATGLYVATVMTCTLDQLEPLLYALDQDKLHPDTYDKYSRSYTSSIDDYKARNNAEVTWTTTLSATPVPGSSYTETINGGLRRIENIDSTKTPFGPILLSHTYMPKAAKFDNGSDSFSQDYQMEVYYERKPGEVVHFYPVWRQMKVDGFGSDGGFLQDREVSAFEDWDGATGDLCKKGTTP